MKWLARTLVFALTFALGAILPGALSSLSEVGDVDLEFDSLDEHSEMAPSPSGVKVIYLGLDRTNTDRPRRLRFLVYNGLSLPIRYSAHQPDGAFPRLTIAGREIPPIAVCGNGISTYFILPGRSTEMTVSALEFTEVPRANDSITAGFYFLTTLPGRGAMHFSEPFLLPSEFRDALRRSK